MMRILLLLSVIFPFLGHAQYEVRGRVLKPDGSALRSMSLGIYRGGEKPALKTLLSDSTGAFSFSLTDPGNYKLRTQSLFYRDSLVNLSISASVRVTDIGNLVLQHLSKTLSNVTVAAAKQPVEFRDDHMVFNPAADASIGARPVSEMLNRIPGIAVDGRNQVLAKGQEGVQLLVNGRVIRTAPGDYLAQLSADEVERIEVYDNATRFSYIKAAVIINIILKNRPARKLWNAALSGNTLPKIAPSFDASISFGKQRLYSRLSHDISNMQSAGYHTRSADTVILSQNFSNRTRHTMSTARLGWEYFIDSTITLSTEGNYTRHNDRLNALIDVRSPAGDFENDIQSSPVEHELAGWVALKKDNKQKGYKFFEAGLTHFSLTNSRNLPGVSLKEERVMNNQSFGWKAEWQKNLPGLRILNGVAGQLTGITDHIDTPSIARRINSRFHTNTITSYHEVNRELKKWNLALGATIDYINMDWNRSGNADFRYSEFFVNPSFRLNRTKGQVKTSFAYNRKYILPSTHFMFGQYSQYEYGRTAPGNYSLRPAVQDLLKFSVTRTGKFTLLWELYYDYTKDPAMMLYRINGWSVTDRPENLQSRSSVGSVLSVSLSPLSFYAFTLNLDGRLNDHKLKEKFYLPNPRTWSANATFINRFTVNKKLNLSLNATIHNWRNTVYRTMEHFLVYTMQGSYKASQRMNISFGINDIFDNMRFGYEGILAPAFYESSYSKDKMRNFSFTLRYQLINSQLEKKAGTVKSFISE